jgi:hypothetical protein
VGLAVTLWPSIREVLGSNSLVAEISRGLSQHLQANAGILPQLDQDIFLPNPLQFVSNRTIYCYTATKSVIK